MGKTYFYACGTQKEIDIQANELTKSNYWADGFYADVFTKHESEVWNNEIEPCVYFISDGSGHIKIGKTNCLSKRIKQLQTANPLPLTVIFSIIGDNEKQIFLIEKRLHKLFNKYKSFGEWFEEEPILDFLNSDMSEILKDDLFVVNIGTREY